MCASQNSETRGVNDPSRIRAGRQSQTCTGVVHAPAYPSTIWGANLRTAQGAVRSLGDRSRKFPHFSVLLRREHNSLFQSPRKSEPLTSIARGTTSKF
jgi:hypothetical protein